MPGTADRSPLRVVVYGGGVVALEAALALCDGAGDRCELMLVSPVRDLTARPLPCVVASRSDPGRFDLAAIAAESGLAFRADAIVGVDTASRTALTLAGAKISFDALVLASGARPRPAVPGATTYRDGDVSVFEELIDELLSGACERAVFAIPSSTGWTLPVYETALAVATRIAGCEPECAALSIVTHERRAVEILGPQPSEVIARWLANAGIELVTGHDPEAFDGRNLVALGERRIATDRVLAPAAMGVPRIAGLPTDERGFVPVDADNRVIGLRDVWAVGDLTGFSVREPGIAARRARSVAAAIAADPAAAPISNPDHAIVRGRLRRSGQKGGPWAGPIWWPPGELAGKHVRGHLGPRLGELRPPDEDALSVRVELSRDGRPVALS